MGLEGELALYNHWVADAPVRLSRQAPRTIVLEKHDDQRSPSSIRCNYVVRGGFDFGSVDGLPSNQDLAALRMTWKNRQDLRYPVPNLARNEVRISSNHIVQIWLRYLLTNRSHLPDGQLYGCRFRYDPRSIRWLEEFDALALYELAKDTWCKCYNIDIASIQDWEDGKGPALIFSDSLNTAGLVEDLLDMVLPFITTLILYPGEKYYVKPPHSGWRETLKQCKHYVSRAKEWDVWIEYEENIGEYLIYRSIFGRGHNFLNIRFKDKLIALFTDEEIGMLKKIIYSWEHVSKSTGQLLLTPEESGVLTRAHNAAGELVIGTEVNRWRLNSIPIPIIA
jgi:hypothetical protein